MKRQYLIISAGVLPILIIALFPSEWWIRLLLVANLAAVICVVASALRLMHLYKMRTREPYAPSTPWPLAAQPEGEFQNN